LKFSFNWIRELADVPETASARALERLITMKTAECEGVEQVGALLAGACLAAVTAVEEMPGGHNRKAAVETARYGPKTVVCGAPNCRPGMTAVYVPAGVRTIGGVASDGMLASGAELGVNRDTSGILDLTDGGTLERCAPDEVIEIDNKSITHRPDLWGHYGMAREVAALYGSKLRDPVRMELLPGGPPVIRVAIEDFDLCARYSALVFENVSVRPSPPWLQYRLEAIGLNPINNIVDFTNYVMAELGQPTHAFDRARIAGDTIFIRPARAGERMRALNGEEYELSAVNQVIADASGPIAIAGVIGGDATSITGRTASLILESANFLASSVRKTSAQLKLRTDASMRFEKAQDPENTTRALARAVELLAELSPGIRLVGGVADERRAALPAPGILLPLDWLARKLGRSLAVTEVREILERLGFGVSQSSPEALTVAVPSWRATKDVSVKDDLVEEVGRMIGYSSIEPRAPALAVSPPKPDPKRLFHRELRALLTGLGFTEVYNSSFVNAEEIARFGFDPAAHMAVLNPIAAGQELLRTSLLPGIRRNISENARYFERFRLFEIGREIHRRPEGLPDETAHLAAAVYARDDGAPGLFELKHAVETILPGAEIRPAAARVFEHPARAAEVHWRGAVVGRLFEFGPAMEIDGRAAVLDLDLREVGRRMANEVKYAAPGRYPSSEFDLSVLAGMREYAGDLRVKIASFAGPLVESVDFVRQYSGDPLPDGVKSVTFRLRVGSPERTLASAEVSEIRTAIIEGMRGLGYELRV
jgi:phenylalanyl-tRNA synthetase beta chain